MGEEVKALVQLAPDVTGSDSLAKELIDYLRDRIAHYKAPRSVDFVDDLPRTPTGKLAKNKLRQQVRVEPLSGVEVSAGGELFPVADLVGAHVRDVAVGGQGVGSQEQKCRRLG